MTSVLKKVVILRNLLYIKHSPLLMAIKNSTLAVIIISFFIGFTIPSNANVNSSSLMLVQNHSNSLVENDTLYKASLLINKSIKRAKAHNNQELLADNYYALGNIFTQMGSHNIANTNYYNAFAIYDKNNKLEKKDFVLTHIAISYLYSKDFKKFDSIIPIALAHSKAQNSVNILTNLELLVVKNYYIFNSEESIRCANEALKILNTPNYVYDNPEDNLSISRLKAVFNYYKGIALTKLSDSTEGFDLLFTIDEDLLYNRINIKEKPKNELATLNYYKYLYYKKSKKDLDLANKYLLISDTYKYYAIRDLEVKAATNGDLIAKVINTQNQLDVTTELIDKDKIINKSYLIALIVSGLLLLLLGGFLFHYYTNRIKIKFINSKLKASNKKLLEIDKERLEFFSILSHELRTPIYGISGLANVIKQETSKDKKDFYLNALLSSSNYISLLIDNILQASKLKFEKKTLQLDPNKLSEVITSITNTINLSATNKGLQLKSTTNITGNDHILMDKVLFSQILINLAYNAIRYTKEGTISIHANEVGRTEKDLTILFEITDTGIGIEEKHRELVFNAFENKTFLKNNSSGSGLGLYIVKTLLKSHDSDINFTSKPGEGSTFYFTITFQLSEAEKENHLSLLLNQSKTHKILVVDDNKINLLVTQKNVEKIPSCVCEITNNGYDAIKRLQENHYDLVLMDINMPEIDGYGTTKRIRAFNKTIPILALTALNSNDTNEKVKSSDMNYIITKPYDFNEFQEIISSFLMNSCKV